MANGHRSVYKFSDHYAVSEPTPFVQSHYADLATIKNQTAARTAGWFMAKLKNAESGAEANTLHVIYCATEGGKPITDVSKAKVCAAPEPPFNGEDGPDMESLLMEIRDLLVSINQNFNK